MASNVPVKVAIRFKPSVSDFKPDGYDGTSSRPSCSSYLPLGVNNVLPRASISSLVSPNVTIVKENNSIVIYDLSSAAINGGQPKVVDEFCFEAIFEQDAATIEVYNEVKPLVQNALNGYNATIFAYGQSHTGKTYTIFGNERSPGIVILALDDIFRHIAACEKNRFFIVRLALLEIHKEQLRDLADNDQGSSKRLRLRETSTGFIFIENLIEEICADSYSARQIVTRYLARRHNSHVICRIIIESKQIDGAPNANLTNVSEINFVVLAGSEGAIRRISLKPGGGQHRASELETLKEYNAINRSLLMLGLVIQQLSEGQTVANFRNSLLTRVLQNALSGNSYTAVICTISPHPYDMKNNLSTLKFAAMAKQIRTRPQLNGAFPIEHAVLPRLQIRTASLKRRLSNNTPSVDDEGKNNDESVLLEEPDETPASPDQIREQLMKEIFADDCNNNNNNTAAAAAAAERHQQQSSDNDNESTDGHNSFDNSMSCYRGRKASVTRRMSWAATDGHAVLKLMAPDSRKVLDDEEDDHHQLIDENREADNCCSVFTDNHQPSSSAIIKNKGDDEIVYDNLLISGSQSHDVGEEEDDDEEDLAMLAAKNKLHFIVGDSVDCIPAFFCPTLDDPDNNNNYVSKTAYDSVVERMKSMKRQVIARLPASERAEVADDDEFETLLERLCSSFTCNISRRNSVVSHNNNGNLDVPHV